MQLFSLSFLAILLASSRANPADSTAEDYMSISEVISMDPVLDRIDVDVSESNTQALEAAAAQILEQGLSGIYPGAIQSRSSSTAATYRPIKTYFDPKGTAHVRLGLEKDGYQIEGAAMSMHIESDGNIMGYNGEAFSGDDAGMPADRLPSSVALEEAAYQGGLSGEWMGSPMLTAVMSRKTQSLCWAWKQTLFYETTDENTGAMLPHKDDIYAHVTTGDVSDVNNSETEIQKQI